MRRVVVTGLGLLTPIGYGVDVAWGRLIEGQSGIGAVQSFDVADLPCRVAGEIPIGDGSDGSFNVDDCIVPKEQRKMDRFIIYAMAAAIQAVEASGWKPEDEEDQNRTGVMIGSGIGGLPAIAEAAICLQ